MWTNAYVWHFAADWRRAVDDHYLQRLTLTAIFSHRAIFLRWAIHKCGIALVGTTEQAAQIRALRRSAALSMVSAEKPQTSESTKSALRELF